MPIVGLFLEDIAHEKFLLSLTKRVVRECGLDSEALHTEVRNATGGRGVVFNQLGRFVRDVARERQEPFDLLIIAIDSNCHGYRTIESQLRALLSRANYKRPFVFAIPEPHIEAWYLADTYALQRAIEGASLVGAPSPSCRRGRQPKQVLREAIESAGIQPLLGGAEFAEAIVDAMDMERAAQAVHSLRRFAESLRTVLRTVFLSPN